MTIRRYLSPLVVFLVSVAFMFTANPAYADTQPDNSWFWHFDSLSSGWSIGECALNVTCPSGGATNSTLQEMKIGFPGLAAGHFAFGRLICSDGSTPSSWAGVAVSGSTSAGFFQWGISKTACPDSFASAGTVQFADQTNSASWTGPANVQYEIRFNAAIVITPACADDTTATGSAVGTALAVRVHDGTVTPTSGWRVDVPDPGNTLPTTASLTIPLSATVDGYPNYYFTSTTLASAPSILTARVTAMNGTTALCYVAIDLSTNAITGIPTADNNPATSSDAGDGTSCGFSLNPVHWVTCLFYPPSSATTQWSSRITALKSDTPINVMVAGYSYVHDTFNLCPLSGSPGSCQQVTGDGAPGNFYAMAADGSADTSNYLNPLSSAAYYVQNTTGGQVIYGMLKIILWVGFLLWAWGRVSASFGGKESDT